MNPHRKKKLKPHIQFKALDHHTHTHTQTHTHKHTHKIIIRWAGHVARMEDRKGAYRVLVGIPDGKRLLGRPRRRGEDNIKMNHQ